MNITESQIEEFVAGYVSCAQWSSNLDEYDLADEGILAMVQQCKTFISEHHELLCEYRAELDSAGSPGSWAQVGHDFWLTRNGHGTGFWDQPAGTNLHAVGAKLTAFVGHGTKYPTVELYVGDDGLAYIE